LSAPIQGVRLRTEARVFRDPLILILPNLGSNKNLDQFENEAHHYSHW
jgi:hypothetical protein